MQTESWMCRPPNVLMFNLNRVDYDRSKQRLVKNNKRFEFDQTIYLDMFLNQNKEKANEHKQTMDRMKQDLKQLKKAQLKYQHANHSQNLKLVSIFEECIKLVTQIADNQDESLNSSVLIDG